MPEEFPEEMRKALEENDLRDAVWVANVNGRYLGVDIGSHAPAGGGNLG